MVKKALKIILFTFLGLIGIAFATPFLFKGKILAFVKKEMNASIRAKADFKDLDLSFLRHFPKATVAIKDVNIIGVDDFLGDSLLSAKAIDVDVNLMSIIRGSGYRVHAITINEPRIHALVNKEGKANWDIAKPDTVPVTKEEKPFQLQLDGYAINNGYIEYRDEVGNMSTEIAGLNHSGSGNITSDLYTLSTKTHADAVTFTYGGVPYLNRTKTTIDADIKVDNKTNTYRFKTDKISLNELPLSTEGFFQLVNDTTYQMDIKYSAPSTEFRHILSLVPVVYQQNFANIKTSGQAAFNGFVKGIYSNNKMPGYHVNLDIKDGFFQYPDLPKPVQRIQLTMKLDNANGITDNAVIEIPKGHIEFGNDPFDFRFIFKNPLTSKFLDAGAKGKLDLASLTQFIKLPTGTKLAGLVDADIAVKGNMAALQKQEAGDFSGKGFLNITNLFYASSQFPQPIQNTQAKINIESPDGVPDHTVVSIPTAHVEVGSDKADITLQLKNPISNPAFDGTLKGAFDLSKVKQFYTFEQGTSLAGIVNGDIAFKGTKSMIDKKQYDAVQTSGIINASGINYVSKAYPGGVQLKTTTIGFTPKNINISNLEGSFMKTNFSGNGAINNAIGYALKDEPLIASFNLKADKVNLNDWMGTPDTNTNNSAKGSSAPFAVPANLQVTLNTLVDKVLYDKVDYNSINGALLLANQTITLKNVRMETLGGTMQLNGDYSTKNNKNNPDISISYDLKNLDVQKTFTAYNTVQKLMPIAQFLDGKLSSQLTMTGRLGMDMFPQLNSLTGNGNMLLIEGFLRKFAPLEKLASLVDIKDLENISLRDVKNYISFADGKVAIKPFKVKVKDIEMEIGGMHGFDQTVDYIINMKVPRAMMGAKGNALINNLVSQVSNKGIPLKISETVNLHLKMGGSIKNPVLSTDIKQSATSLADELKQQALETAKQKADSTKTAVTNTVKDTLKSVKNQVLKDAELELKKRLFQKNDSGAANGANGTNDTRKKVEESAKGLLNEFNPFKKKKKQADTLPPGNQ